MVGTVSTLPRISESSTPATVSSYSTTTIMHPSPLSSHPFRIPTPSFSDLDIPTDLQFPSRPISELNAGGTRTSYLGGDLADAVGSSERLTRLRRSRDDIGALIEFLRTHEPPPDNFMSQPYSTEEEDRGRWEKLKVMGRKRSKSMPRAPAPIRLPDSAVAGVTTGGHRHIAISIPLDASHFGETPKSQYPVYDKSGDPPVPPLPQSVRTFTNDKGVVTVLRPLSNDHYNFSIPPSPSSPRRFDRDRPPQLLRNRRMVSSSPPPPSPAESDSWPLASPGLETSFSALPHRSSCDFAEHSRPVVGTVTSRTAEFVRAAYPSRGSSMVASPRIQHHHTSSIDEVIAEDEPYIRNPSPMPREGVLRRNTERRLGRPPVSLATSPVARKSTSNLRSEWQVTDEARMGRQPRVPVIPDSPVLHNRDESPSPPASLVSVKSRREKVRDKKLRDLAAARSAKPAHKEAPAKGSVEEQPLHRLAKDGMAEPARGDDPGPKLSTIMVVVDMKPDDEEETRGAETSNGDDTGSVTEALPEPAAETPGSLVCPGNPTPPASTETSPSQTYGFDTRTSLTRRREWQSNREQERKKRETAALAKAHLRHLAASGSYDGMDGADPEREVLRLYEAYRERRFREMESRLHRLEQNGDAWLRALTPMLEDMDGSGTSAGPGSGRQRPTGVGDEGLRARVPDNGAASGPERHGRVSQRRKLVRRASLSRERMLEELTRRGEREMLDKHGAGVPLPTQDASGMGSIEPLMRELAGGQPATGEASGYGPAAARGRPRAARQSSEGGVPRLPLKLNHSVQVS